MRLQRGIYLVTSENEKGYLRIRISKSREEKYTLLIHRLVAQAFIPNPNNLPQVNHKDGNKKNNCVDNLEWCDNSYNQIHAFENGLNDHTKYEAGIPKRKVAQLDDNNRILAIYKSLSEASVFTNISRSLIGKTCKGKRNHTGGYRWLYATENMKVGDVI